LLAAYPLSKDGIPKSARNLSRDAAFSWQTWNWANLQSQTSQDKVFLYYFDQHQEYPKDSPKYGQGSPHGQDVAYVFQTLNDKNPDITPSDIKVSDLISTYWTNFAKTGNPNGKGVPEWPAF